jgi:hypothetical protein
LRFPGGPSGRRSYRARPNHVSNSSSTARWMINRAPSRASSDRILCGSSTIPLDNNMSILACISADGGTVRLTA